MQIIISLIRTIPLVIILIPNIHMPELNILRIVILWIL